MKLYQMLISENISGSILYLIILLANIDYVGLLDYALKAIIGSLAWFVFRVLGERYIQKIRNGANKSVNETDKQS